MDDRLRRGVISAAAAAALPHMRAEVEGAAHFIDVDDLSTTASVGVASRHKVFLDESLRDMPRPALYVLAHELVHHAMFQVSPQHQPAHGPAFFGLLVGLECRWAGSYTGDEEYDCQDRPALLSAKTTRAIIERCATRAQQHELDEAVRLSKSDILMVGRRWRLGVFLEDFGCAGALACTGLAGALCLWLTGDWMASVNMLLTFFMMLLIFFYHWPNLLTLSLNKKGE